jgi:hypothetical protein
MSTYSGCWQAIVEKKDSIAPASLPFDGSVCNLTVVSTNKSAAFVLASGRAQ